MTQDAKANALHSLDAHELGGKALNLRALSAQGLPVPPWAIVPTSMFKRFMAASGLEAVIRTLVAGLDFEKPDAARTASETIRRLFDSSEIPEAMTRELKRAYKDQFAPETYVAVRSSAVGEDGAKDSFAGQMDSFLFVKGTEAVLKSIKRCWASAYSERAIAYRHLKGLDPVKAEVAVIVQEMVPADVSGVMFTADPLTGDRDTVVINGTYGLGEGIVSGALDTDSFTVNKKTKHLTTETVNKPKKIAFASRRGHGTYEANVAAEQQDIPCLTDEQAQALANWGMKVEAHFGKPQDIEWAIANDRIYILQARPITNLKVPQTTVGKEIIWDNSNITESYSGVTSPLTFSFASHAYNIVYNQVSAVLGIPEETIKANEQTYRNLLGLVRGRVFYNLGNWYQMTSLLPGFNYNKGFMDQMMGVKEKADYQKGEKNYSELPKLLYVCWRLLDNYRRIDKSVAWFQGNFERAYAHYKTYDWKAMRPDEIKVAFHDLEQKLLWQWKAPILTDISAMVFYGVLKKLCVGWCGDETGSLQNDLLCGEGEIESTEPTKAIMRMALAARADEALRAFFESNHEREIWGLLQQDDRFPTMRAQVQDFLDKYGYRCMNELKLEEKNLKEDPSFVFAMVKNYLKMPSLDIAAMEANEKRIRTEAETLVRQKLGGNPLKHAFFNWVLMNARRHVKNRENMRFARTKIFGLLRDMFQSIGRTFAGWDLLDDAQDVFYLNLDEIWGFIQGTATSTNLRGLAALRKEEFARYRAEEIDDRFKSYGTVHFANHFVGEQPEDQGESDPNVLKGISCCPGVVKEKVRVIRSPEDDMRLNGEILVAERTDPGWVPLYPAASGLLIERGSILSHSAIVARELGLPTIVGIKGLTRRVQDGQVVEMDARQGTVRL
ncbi:phosphoenolpyruvate synthase [bacterium]|nr:phosphoenolpyruvate synthase [bacterium]